MKILVVAYACNPYHGSEHGVGWEWLKMISKHNKVDIITAHFEKDDLEKWKKNNPEGLLNVNFHYPEHRFWHYHKRSRIWLWIENSPFKIIMNWSYRLWQKDAYKIAHKIFKNKNIDLCHLITYVGFRFPGKFYKLDCPFVWGPIGGLENTPWHLLKLLGPYGKVYYAVRNIINNFDKKFLKHPKRAFKKAALSNSVIAATSGIQKEIYQNYNVSSSVICETGPANTDSSKNIDIIKRLKSETLRICWSGTHTDGKALPLLLDALNMMPNKNWHLDVLGSGPRSKEWKNKARDLGMTQLSKFHGNLKRDEALRVMRNSHLFVITSLKDLTSTVLLEALSLSIPVIAPDHCGFSDIITEDCGIKVPIHDIEIFKQELSNSILFLQLNERRRQEMACNADIRSSELSWGKKYEKIQDIYDRCLS